MRVSIQQATVSRDAAKGKVLTWPGTVVAADLTASVHLYSRAMLDRLEGAGNASGPGTQVSNKVFFDLRPPFPQGVSDKNCRVVLNTSLTLNGAVMWPAGTVFTINTIRSYAQTMQIDAERMT